jgi:hypothetical protein
MPYFPDQIMPLSNKIDTGIASSAASVSSNDYIKHDQEIQAIESFILGVHSSEDRPYRTVPPTLPLKDRINTLIREINNYVTTGFITTSAAITTADKTTKANAPSLSPVCFLQKSVGATDTNIFVSDTSSFPDSGYISLVSDSLDAGKTTTEYVYYREKDSISFKGCQRGAFETSTLSIGLPDIIPNQDLSNKNDDCLSSSLLPNKVCLNRWTSFNQNTYAIPPLGISGTIQNMVDELASYPQKYVLGPSSSDMDLIKNAADNAGILGTKDGQPVLISADATSRAFDRLLAKESDAFLGYIITNQSNNPSARIFMLESVPSNIKVGNDPVPVFGGLVSIQYTPCFWRKGVGDPEAYSTSVSPKFFRPALTGGFAYGVVAYNIFCSSLPRSV